MRLHPSHPIMSSETLLVSSRSFSLASPNANIDSCSDFVRHRLQTKFQSLIRIPMLRRICMCRRGPKTPAQFPKSPEHPYRLVGLKSNNILHDTESFDSSELKTCYIHPPPLPPSVRESSCLNAKHNPLICPGYLTIYSNKKLANFCPTIVKPEIWKDAASGMLSENKLCGCK